MTRDDLVKLIADAIIDEGDNFVPEGPGTFWERSARADAEAVIAALEAAGVVTTEEGDDD